MKHNKITVHKKKIHISLVLLPICMLILFGIAMGWFYVKEMEAQIYESMEMADLRIAADCDAFMNQVVQVYGEILKMEEILELVDEKMPTMRQYSDIKDTIEEFEGPGYLDNYVEGFSYVNLEHGWVLSNRGLYSFDELMNKDEIYAVLETEVGSTSWKRSFWLNGTDKKSGGNRNEVHLAGMSYVILQPLYENPIRGIFVVNIKMNDFFQSQEVMEYDLMVKDSQDNLVYCSNVELLDREGRNYLQYQLVSEATDWSYIIYSEPVDFWRILGGVGIVFCLLMFLLMITLIYAHQARERIYQPVSELIHQTRELNQDDNEVSDEFVYLKNNIATLFQNKNQMEQQLKKHITQLSEYFMRRLLNGELTDDVYGQMDQIGISAKKWYCLIAIGLVEQKHSSLESRTLLLSHDIPGEILHIMLMEPYWNGKDVIFLAGGDTKEILIEEIDKFFSGLEEYVDKSVDCCLFAAVSRMFDNITKTNYAYYECQEALKCSTALRTHDDISRRVQPVYYEEVSHRKEMRVIYNINLEKKLEEAIGEGDIEKSKQLIDEFLEWIKKNEFSSYELSMVLYHLLTTILTTVNNAGISVNEVFRDVSKNIYHGIYMLYRPSEIREFFRQDVLEPVIYYINETRANAADQVWNKIVALIEDNEGNITLNECADYLGYHPGYVWRVMKSRVNMSFSDYLSDYKLKLAKKLLEETDNSVMNIAERLNYSSAQNFIRFFSKSEGVTPGKYRNMHKK